MICAVITAAGRGSRMGTDIPKQFLKIGGKTVLERATEPFLHVPGIARVVLTVPEKDVTKVRAMFARIGTVAGNAGTARSALVAKESTEHAAAAREDSVKERCAANETNGQIKASATPAQTTDCMAHTEIDGMPPVDVIAGGAERQDSVYRALLFLEARGVSPDAVVLVHDGARPYVTPHLIAGVLRALEAHTAVVPGVPPRDTVRRLSGETLNRNRLLLIQTPQGFRFGALLRAYRRALSEGARATDDAELVRRAGEEVYMIPGERTNGKITYPEDIPTENRIGTGFDVHRLVSGRALILGGVSVPFDRGLFGHSDADVLTHALMDALLGAAGLADIGTYFPDSDPAYENVDSLRLLEQVMRMLGKKGFSVINADMTLICERPGLAAYIPEMKEKLAAVLHVDPARLGLKATTTEGLGFTGRGEGIAAQAVCMLRGGLSPV